jgi:CRISPR/Cas system CSM-associated protein Csm3 (group 7 of RAMP superfamily)
MLRTIRYALTFQSPLLISSNAAQPGLYDRIATLDNDGFPCVPGSSVRGRVKDAIRGHLEDNQSGWSEFRICEGQGAAPEEGAYCDPDGHLCPLCRIFGAPGGKVRRGFDFSGAYYSPADVGTLQKAFKGHDLSDASLSRRARNQRDDALRRAREDYLFTDGVAEIFADLEGVVREMPAHLRFEQDTQTFDYRLLLLGLRLTSEMGASRNRGYGRCEFRSADTNDWNAEIKALCRQWKTTVGESA